MPGSDFPWVRFRSEGSVTLEIPAQLSQGSPFSLLYEVPPELHSHEGAHTLNRHDTDQGSRRPWGGNGGRRGQQRPGREACPSRSALQGSASSNQTHLLTSSQPRHSHNSIASKSPAHECMRIGGEGILGLNHYEHQPRARLLRMERHPRLRGDLR